MSLDETEDSVKLLVNSHFHVEVSDPPLVAGGLTLMDIEEMQLFVEQFLCELLHLDISCCRQDQCLHLPSGNVALDLAHLVSETHVKSPVDLVHDQHSQVVHHEVRGLVHVLQQSTRSGHEDVHLRDPSAVGVDATQTTNSNTSAHLVLMSE